MMLTSTASPDLVNISIPNAAIVAVLGYFVVFVGLILLMLGIIGEYVGRIYISLNNSPQFVIRECIDERDSMED